MTSIRTNCPRCGEVEMRADVISLTLEKDSGEGTYSFTCPSCDDRVEKPADRKIVSLLRSVGVDIVEKKEPEEHPEQKPDGPPLSVEDAIDLHFFLEQEDWLEQLADGT